jgi:predicted ATPase
VDWSFQLLSATERLMLGRCRSFQRRGRLEAAEYVVRAGKDRPGDVLASAGGLVSKSLVMVVDEA